MQENHRKDDCFPREANQGNGREYHFLGVRRVQETDGLAHLHQRHRCTLAAALIVATGGFTYFDNAKQLTRYLGLSPIYQQFGTSVNVKGHINQNGDSNLRSQLYVAAFSSLRCNAECKACFDRLRSNGKPGKVAVVAVANKLIRQAFAVVTQGKPYVDGFKSEKP